jgi:hypothetical protein
MVDRVHVLDQQLQLERLTVEGPDCGDGFHQMGRPFRLELLREKEIKKKKEKVTTPPKSS